MAVREWEKVEGRVKVFSPFVRLSEPRVGAVNARVKGAQRKVLNRVDLLLSLAGGNSGRCSVQNGDSVRFGKLLKEQICLNLRHLAEYP